LSSQITDWRLVFWSLPALVWPDSGRAGLIGGPCRRRRQTVSVAIHVIWVAIGQAGVDLAGGGAGTSCLVVGDLLVFRL